MTIPKSIKERMDLRETVTETCEKEQTNKIIGRANPDLKKAC